MFPTVRDRVQKTFASGVFSGIHIFSRPAATFPDDWQLPSWCCRLIRPSAQRPEVSPSTVRPRFLKTVATNRAKQNRLIFSPPTTTA